MVGIDYFLATNNHEIDEQPTLCHYYGKIINLHRECMNVKHFVIT